MQDSIQIGRLFGIPIRLHFTFLLVIPLFTYIIGYQIEYSASFLEDIYGLPYGMDLSLITAGTMPYVLGAVVTISLFAGVLIHELAHSVVALSKGLEVTGITLLILGGISSIDEGKSPDPAVELPMALAGPVASLIIGILTSAAAYISFVTIQQPAYASLIFYILGYLGFLNVLLFLFNLIPAFPMDGGRVLRALLAKRMPIHRATKIAADVGRGFAIIFGIVGLLVFSPVLIIIAVFVYLGAGQEASVMRYNELLKDVYVKDAMSSPVTVVSPRMPLSELVDLMYQTRHLGFPVMEGQDLVGMVTLTDAGSRSSIDSEALVVGDVMSSDLLTVSPSQPLADVLKLMSVQNIGRIPVVKNGRVAGIVTRTDILKFLEIKEHSGDKRKNV
ncbi:CBS domain-containing protein [Methanoplanus limicola]|uniref:Zinc metalloprotease n=1 Tax=Methanoplanus limicola DSM 2279 TaxID=937775 RepID=H1Z3Y9_9EURY|nr:CBS domain-containing protein [Methanoplanus limicola]EHQ36611.1 CBS domain containing protein [Methanoplanus limicola DSM 2279]